MSIESEVNLSQLVPAQYAGQRLDQALAVLFPMYSRETLKKWILDGNCLVNGIVKLPKFKIKGEEVISINATLTNYTANYVAEDLPLNLIYEDQDILIVNKPSNLVVHPGPGNWSGTLLNALLNYDPNLNLVPRAGIVHRLDEHTSGLMVIAKNTSSYHHLIAQFKARTVTKIYETIVKGNIITGGVINAPIGRHKHHRLKMQVIPTGKPALTHYDIIAKFKGSTHIKLKLETGRTHQIRVHLQSINHPIIGDRLYGRSSQIKNYPHNITHQILHATALGFIHPRSLEKLYFTADLPENMKNILEFLANNYGI